MPNDERWQDVKRIVADALERPEHERAAFLDRACTDADLRRRVDELLIDCAQADAAAEFLREPAPAFAAPLIAHLDLAASETPDAPAELRTALAGRYTIERELGRGGMATVYLARDERHHRAVALKVVHPELTAIVGDSLGARRFQREIEIAAQLNHPHILPLYDSGASSGHLYYIMPYVDGETLRARLARDGALAIGDAIRVLRDLARALVHAHRHGVVHRDIKPENILLNRDGDALVTDFGVAKALAAAVNSDQPNVRETLSTIGMVLGTPAYMAPEQALGDAETDHRADLYALGLVAYEVLTGAPPFTGRSVQELAAAHLTKAPAPIDGLRPDVPPALASLVMQLLAKAPAERPQDATQVLRVLDVVGVATSAGVVTPPTSEHTRFSRRVVFGVGALVAVAAVGLLVTLWRGNARVVPDPSIAVLPFVSTSGNADDEPFTDGLTDELIAALSRVPTVRVVARTSSFALKGKNLAVQTIADTLHVNMLVEGTVRRDQDRFKVATQLIDARDNRVIWSASYDRNRHDVLDVQEDIARAIATALSVRLTGTGAAGRLASRATEDFEAYQLYSKGRYFFNTRRRADLHRAAAYFAEATQRDPTFARAYAGLADAYSVLGILGFERPHDVFPKARAAAERALALDPNLGEAHSSLAHLLFAYDWNWKASEESFKTSIALDPTYPQTRLAYAVLLQDQSRWEEALAQLRVMRELDPLSPTGLIAGRTYVNSRRPDSAIRVLNETLELNPRSELTLQLLGHAYVQKGMHNEAIDAFRRAAALSGVRDSAHLAYGYAVTGRRAEAKALIETLVSSEQTRYLPPFHIALAYAGLGDKDAAFRWLERGYDEHASFMDGLKVTPGFDALHSDPRFVSLLERMHF